MTTSPTLPYRPIAEQVAAARAGEYAGETEEQRLQRYAGAAAVGRGALDEAAEVAVAVGGHGDQVAPLTLRGGGPQLVPVGLGLHVAGGVLPAPLLNVLLDPMNDPLDHGRTLFTH